MKRCSCWCEQDVEICQCLEASGPFLCQKSGTFLQVSHAGRVNPSPGQQSGTHFCYLVNFAATTVLAHLEKSRLASM